MEYDMYALIDYTGKQILIKEGEKVKIPFIDQKVGYKIVFENVLLFDDGKTKKIGNPYLKSLSFSGKIESHGKEKKVIVFKKKRRKGHQKKNGHQQKFTYVTIDKFSKPTKKSTAKPKAKTTPKTAIKSKKATTKKGDK
jgi:large subunit ribosomal protein L21